MVTTGPVAGTTQSMAVTVGLFAVAIGMIKDTVYTVTYSTRCVAALADVGSSSITTCVAAAITFVAVVGSRFVAATTGEIAAATCTVVAAAD